MIENNVYPFRKSDKFGVYLGHATADGEIVEGESVGVAYLKPGSKKFRLKLCVWPNNNYFIVPDDRDDKRYVILCLEEFTTPDGVAKSVWHQIGYGNLLGNLIALRIQLISDPIYLCLFPEAKSFEEEQRAA